MAVEHAFVATCAPGLEAPLARELAALGLDVVREDAQAVHFGGPLEAGYRVCLWSRIASRVLLFLRRCFAGSTKALYAELRKIAWSEHLAPDGSLAVHFIGGNDAIRNTQFGAQKVKDAVVDALRDDRGGRPRVDLDEPDVRVHVALKGTWATVSLDLSGKPLHLRGRGRDGGPAPLKENLAAGILWLSGYAEAGDSPLVDPMCGSGTFLTEAAGIIGRRAAGRHRSYWGFAGWRGHNAEVWSKLIEEADERARPVPEGLLFGGDRDPEQCRRARRNLSRAEFDQVSVVRRDLDSWRAPDTATGWVVTNPPFGARLGDDASVEATWRLLGDVLRRRFSGWQAWLLAGSPALAKKLGLRPRRRIPLFHGALEGRLLHVPIADRPPARFQGA
ncbi:MAG: THUMP domain-containing protein [Myxococcota bacterium]